MEIAARDERAWGLRPGCHLDSRRNSTTRPCSQRYVAIEVGDSIRPLCTPSMVELPLEVVVKLPLLRSHRWLEVLPPPLAKHCTVGGMINAMKRSTSP
jgi:hypothetical protein